MSTTIDQRVVEMRFDNKQFEQNVSTTMSTLDKLKQKLNLPGAVNGLAEVDRAAKRIDLSGLTNAAETVGLKFNALYTIADQAFRNITNSAYNAGRKIVSAFTIDPIKTGFSEYETQINAVQTILANTSSKGTTINDVNAALDTLNAYADKTIYNFTEMTRNIGTFTAAGIGLDDSVSAIQGIANLAAVSGSTSQQASTAMYQLSQALSTGTVRLMDWNSVVNAGMGGQVFQDALKMTAKNMGKDVDAIIKKAGSFRESLSEGWLTADVLTRTLEQFTMAAEEGSAEWDKFKKSLMEQGYTEEQSIEILKMANTATDAATKVKTFTQLWDTLKESAQSGWTQTWETIVGDFEEAKEFLTELSELFGGIISESANNRNEVISGGLNNNWEKLTSKITEAGVQSAVFEDRIRSAMEAHGLNVDELLKEHKSLEEVFRSGAVSSDILKEAVDSLSGSMVDLSSIEKEIKKWDTGEDVKKVQEALQNLGYDLGDTGIDGSFGNITEQAVKAFQESNELEVTGIIDEKTIKALEEASSATANLSEECGGLIDNIEELGGRELLIQSLRNVFESLKNIVTPVKEAFKEIFPKTNAEKAADLKNAIVKLEATTKKWSETIAANSEKIKSFAKGLFAAVDIAWTFAKDIGGGIATVFKEFLSLFDGLGGKIMNGATSLGEWISGLRDTIKETDYFGIAIDKVVGFMTRAINVIKNFKNKISEAFRSQGMTNFLSVLQGIWNVIKWIGSKIGSVVSSITGALAGALGEFNVGDIFNSTLLASLLAAVLGFSGKISKVLDNVGESFNNLVENLSGEEGILSKITGIFDSVKETLKSYQQQLKAETLKKIAIAIGILAASIWVVSTIDAEKLDRSLGAIGVMFIELLGALAVFNKINSTMKGTAKAVTLMIGMSVAILILSAALKNIASLDIASLGKGLLGIGVLMAEIAGFLYLTKGLESNIKKSAKGLVILSAAILVLTYSVEKLGALDASQMGQGLTAVGVLIGALAVFSKVSGGSKKMVSIGTGLVIMAASMLIFADVVKKFGAMDVNQMAQGLTGMGVALIAVTAAMKLMPKNVLGIGLGLTVVGAALEIIADVVKKLGGVNPEQLVYGLVAMGVALAELALALNFMKGTLGASAAVLVAAGALAILTPVIKALGSMSWEESIRGLLNLAAVLAILGIAGAVIGPFTGSLLKLGASMALIALSVVGLGAGLVLIGAGLSAIGVGLDVLGVSLAASATAVVAAIGVIIVGLLGLIPEIMLVIGEGIKALCTVIIECAPMIAKTILEVVTEVLAALATYTPQIVTHLFDFIIGVLNALAAKMPDLIQAAVNLIGSFFKGVVQALQGIDTTSLIQGIVGFGLLAGLMYLLAGIAGLVPAAMIGVLGMGAVIAEMALVLAAVGAFAQIPGLSWLINEGGELLYQIGNALGKFVGGLIGGIVGGISSVLPQLGADLSGFMINATPFLVGIKMVDASMLEGAGTLAAIIAMFAAAELINNIATFGGMGQSLADLGTELSMFIMNAMPFLTTAMLIKPEMMEGVKMLAETILTLTAADLLSGIASFLGGGSSFENFGTQMASLGAGISSFIDNVGTFTPDQLETFRAAAEAVKILAEAAQAIPNAGGLLASIVGENDLGTFASQFPVLGVGLRGFLTAVGTFSEDQVATVTSAANAVKALAEASQTIPNMGGWLAQIVGDNGLATFAEQFPVLGTGLAGFLANVGTFTDEQVTTVGCAAEAVKQLATVANEIPNTGGLLASIVGDNGLETFANELPSLGTGMAGFLTNLGTFTDEQAATVTCAANAIKALASVANDVPNTGGLLAQIVGDNTLGSFAEQLPAVGTGIAGFAKNLGEFDSTKLATVNAGVSAIEAITALAGLDLGSVASNLGTFGSRLTGFGEEIADFCSDLTSVSSDTLTSAISNVNDLADMLRNLTGFDASAAEAFADAIKSLGKSGVDKFVEEFTGSDTLSKVYEAGEGLANKIVEGIESKSGNVEDASSDLSSEGAKGAKSKNAYNKFKEAGKYLGAGLVEGIKAKEDAVYKAGYALGQKAVQGEKDGQKSKSPSRLTIQAGKWLGEGLIIGMQRIGSKVYKSGYDMGDTATTSISDAIDKSARLIDTDMDGHVTITPILDLSDVESGINTMNGMFGINPSIGVLSNVGTISHMMNSNSQNGTMDDVVSAITKLGKDLGNVGGTHYNINGVTYDDGSNIANAMTEIARAALRERRI